MLSLQDSLAIGPRRLAQLFNRPLAEVEAALKDSEFVKLSLGDEEAFTTTARWEEIKRFTIVALATHHREEPLAPGLEMEALRARLPYEVTPRAFRALVDRVCRETGIVREESALRLAQHRVRLGGDDGKIGARVEQMLKEAGFQPPDLKQLVEAIKLPATELARIRRLLSAMEREGRVVKVATDLYFARHALEAAQTRLIERLKADGEITAAAYRDSLNASRKFAIALLDYFDHSGVTTRVGDLRKLRRN
jgi:selenocysteine-specific elongation factor